MTAVGALPFSTEPFLITTDGILCTVELIEKMKNTRLKCTCYVFLSDSKRTIESERPVNSWLCCVKGALPILGSTEQQNCYTSQIISIAKSRKCDQGDGAQLLVLTKHERTYHTENKKSKIMFIISNIIVESDISTYDDVKPKVTLHMNLQCHFHAENITCENIAVMNEEYLVWFDYSLDCFSCVSTRNSNGERVVVCRMEHSGSRLHFLAARSCNDTPRVLVLCLRNMENDTKELILTRLSFDDKRNLVCSDIPSSESDKLIAKDYIPILSKVFIHELSVDKDEISDAVVYAFTSQKHLLKFHNGKLDWFVRLPSSLECQECFLYKGRCEDYLVVGAYPVVRLYHCDGTRKLAHEELHVRRLLVDDFVGYGSPQLLFTKRVPSPSTSPVSSPASSAAFPSTAWTLTDLCGCYYDNECSRSTQTDVSRQSDNLASVTGALRRRLQHDRLRVEEKGREIDSRLSLLEYVCTNLESVNLGGEPNLAQADTTGLVTLCGEEVDASETRTEPPRGVVTRNTWVSRVDGATVIGVEVANLSDSSMTHLSITPIPIGQKPGIATESRCYWPMQRRVTYPVDQEVDEDWVHRPVIKKARLDENGATQSVLLPGQKTTILCHLENKCLLTSQDYGILLSFNWVSSQDDGTERNATNRNFPSSKFCGIVTVDLDDFKPSDPVISSVQLRMCRDFLYTQTDVHVTSHGAPVDPAHWLRRAGCREVAPGRYNLAADVPASSSCLGEVQLDPHDPTRVTIFTRHGDAVREAVRYIYRIFPDSITVVPASLSPTNVRRLIDTVGVSLANELDTLVKHLNRDDNPRPMVDDIGQTDTENGLEIDLCRLKTDAAIFDLIKY